MIALTSMLGLPGCSQVMPTLASEQAGDSAETFGGGGRPAAVNWSRSAVYGRNGMARGILMAIW